MRATRWRWVAALAVIASVAPFAGAALPPLSQEQLDTRATLIITGTVIDERYLFVDTNEMRTHYVHEATVRVVKVEKGACDPSRPLTVRGYYYAQRFPHPGDAGVRAGSPGDEAKFYLVGPPDDGCGILAPNGVDVLSHPAAQAGEPLPPYQWPPSLYLYWGQYVGGGFALLALACGAVYFRRWLRRRARVRG